MFSFNVSKSLNLIRSFRTMATIGDLRYISREALAKKILEGASEKDLAVIDVRDSDHIGGHIKSSHHFSSTTLDAHLPTLLRKFAGTKTVVFHCALSQQRGPKAALMYLRALEKTGGGKISEGVEQEVVVLDRGFVGWQEVYGGEEELTENYNEELWAAGY